MLNITIAEVLFYLKIIFGIVALLGILYWIFIARPVDKEIREAKKRKDFYKDFKNDIRIF